MRETNHTSDDDDLTSRVAALVSDTSNAPSTMAVLEAEAHAFRSLCEHLRQRPSVQNIDLMTLSGFCRNCLSKWLQRGAAIAGLQGVDDATARAAVYGIPYAEWKKAHQLKSSPEQMIAYKASKGLHAVHTPVDLSDVCCQPTLNAASLPPTLRVDGSAVCRMSTSASAVPASPMVPSTQAAATAAPHAFPMTPVDDAIELALGAAARALATTPLRTEELTLLAAAAARPSRRAAADVHAAVAVPPFRASVMDGYAVIAADGVEQRRRVGHAMAGVDPSFAIARGECSYITTGSKLPEGADAVIQIESVIAAVGGDLIEVTNAVAAGKNVRPVGCDIAIGATLVRSSDLLSPPVLGLLAATGIAAVAVRRRPIVGVFSTGDELVAGAGAATLGRRLGLGGAQIYDANRTALLGAIGAIGAETVDLGVVSDDVGALSAALDDAIARCDVVVSSGGVSMGEADLLKGVLQERGTVHFGRIFMKPGKPTTLTEIVLPAEENRRVLVFSLPGNPVSALVTCELLVAPVLRLLGGAPRDECFLPRCQATLAQSLSLDPIRPEYHRATLRWEGGALPSAHTAGVQRSSRLASLGGTTNALLLLPHADAGITALSAGTVVTALTLAPPLRAAAARESHASAMAAALATPRSSGATMAALRRGAERRSGAAVRICVLTVSDRASAGVYVDESGPSLRRALLGADSRFDVVASRCVPDEPVAIESAVRAFCAEERADVVLTTGGTGFSARDGTPEVVAALIARPASGVVWEMMRVARTHTPLAALSRPVAGISIGPDGWTTFIATLPGSPRAAVQAANALAPLLAPIVDVMRK